MLLKVGCCGYPIAMKKYFRTFKLVEVQSTFYNLPRLSTATAWREKAPEEFEFSMKAWQAVTHPPSSPSWHRTRLKVENSEKESYGSLRPTKENLAAWDETMNIGKALKCKVCVVQTPPSFGFSEENAKATRAFFRSAKRETIIAWEPRGTWLTCQQEIAKLCRKLELVHTVDIMRRRPSFVQDTAYIRLHGLNPREYDYKYHYSESDPSRLAEELHLLEPDVSEAYILFNNVSMLEDAKRFLEMSKKKGFRVA